MNVAALLRGIGPRHDKWTRRRCAAELRRLAEAGALGRRNLRALFANAPGMTLLGAEHLHAAVVSLLHGIRIHDGWSTNRIGTYKRRPLRVKP